MRRIALLAATLFILPASGQMSAASTVPEIAFDSVPDPLQLPKDLHLGEVAGIAVDSKQTRLRTSRGNTTGPAYGAAAAQLLEFDSRGRFLREIGQNLYGWSYAHSVRIDRHDNIWVADKGSDVVVRFNQQGRVTMVFGRKPEASDESAHPLEHPRPPLPAIDGMFRQVTDMTWDSDDNTYISDGYINSRVAKADKDGNWLHQLGRAAAAARGSSTRCTRLPPTGPTTSTWRTVATDASRCSTPAASCCARSASKCRCRAARSPAIGNPLADGGEAPYTAGANWTQRPGAPWTLCITPGPTQYLYVSDSFPGRIYKLSLDGKVLGWLGGAGKTLKKFGWIHAIACPSENELYVAELLNWRVQKLLLHPAP